MLHIPFYNRKSETNEILKLFENHVLRQHKSTGYLIRGRKDVGKTRLAEEFIGKLQDVEFLSDIPDFDPEKNIIRYSCEPGDDTPYKAFVKITEEIYNRSRWLDITKKAFKFLLAVVGVNDALNALNDFVKSVKSDKNDKSIAKKEAKIFNSYRRFLRRMSKKSPIVIFIENVQWLDSYSMKLIGKLLRDNTGLWGVIMLEEDEEETVKEVFNNLNKLVYDKCLYELYINGFDRSFVHKMLGPVFGDGFFSAKELDILYTISEGCPGKLLDFLEKCRNEKWIYKEKGECKKAEDFIEKIKPANQKLMELVISLFEDKVITDSEEKLIKKMAGLWGLADERVNATISMVKDIYSLGFNILYNLDWGIISDHSVLVADGEGHRYIVESIEKVSLDDDQGHKVKKHGFKHKNILEAHEIHILEKEILILWDYFDEKQHRDGIISEIERNIQSNVSKFLDLAIGLAELHNNDIHHGYIRPEAIIEYAPGKFQLATFDNSVLQYLLEAEKNKPEAMQYYPPEYLSGRPWTCKGDIYSFGVLFYRSLTGSFPYYGKTATELLESIQSAPVNFPGHFASLIPAEIRNIIIKCLSFDENERYANASELAEELKKARKTVKGREHFIPEGVEPVVMPEGRKFKRRRAGRSIRKVLVPIATAVGAFLIYWLFIRDSREVVVKKEVVLDVVEKNRTENQNRVLDAGLIRYLLADEIMQSGDATILTSEQFDKIYHDNEEQNFVPSLKANATIVNHDFNYELIVKKEDYRAGGKSERKVFDFTDPSELLMSKAEEITKFILGNDSVSISAFTNDWDAFTNFYYGEKSWEKIDVNNALRYFNKAVAIDTGFVLAKLRMSEIHRFNGDKLEAKRLLNDIIPQLGRLSKADSLKALALKNRIESNYREAIKNMRMILTYLKAQKEPYYDLAEVYFELRDIENAKRNYELALELDPNFTQAINHYAYCFTHTGEHDKALYYFKKYVEIDSSANAFDSYGDGFMAAGKLDSAEWAKKEGIALDPSLDYMYAGLTNIYVRKKEYEKAEENINKYIAHKTSPEALATGYTNKAYIYYSMGEEKMALDTCIKARRHYDAFDLATRNHMMHWLMAWIYHDQGKVKLFDRELADMDTLIARYGIDANNYNELLKYDLHLKALRYHIAGDTDRLLEIARYFDAELWDKVKDWGSPFGPAFFYTEYGRLLMDHDPENARFFIDKALAYNPHYSPALEFSAQLNAIASDSTAVAN